MTHKRKQVNVKGFLRKVHGQRAKVRVKPQRRNFPKTLKKLSEDEKKLISDVKRFGGERDDIERMRDIIRKSRRR